MKSPVRQVVAAALALGAIQVVLRIVILGRDLPRLDPGEAIQAILVSARQDLFIVLAVALSGVLIMRLLREGRAVRAARSAVIAVSMILLIWSALNVVAVRMLGEPVTLAWLAYSDIANNTIVLKQALRAIGVAGLGAALAAAGVFAGLSFLFARALRRQGGRRPGYALIGTGLVLVAATLPPYAGDDPPSPGKTQSPVVALVASALQRDGVAPGALSGDAAPAALLDSLPPATPVARPDARAAGIRNVIIVALESTSFKYVDVPEERFGLTPNIRAHAGQGRSFSNAYVHTPASNFFLVSLLGGIVPELSAFSMTYSYPELELETLSDVLKRRGFRTGFFNTSDNRFQATAEFVSREGFDTVLDHRDWPCESGVYEFENADYRFLNTSNEQCSVAAMKNWISADPDRPFFITFRTGMTHYPYFAGDDPRPYVEDPDLNRYMNAIRVADEAFGDLMAFLKAGGLLDETLVVVIGDHGESFGEHGNYVHGGGLYEENIHIPFILINPALFSGGVEDAVVGLSDIAPTVADLLGLPAPAAWHGESVFSPGRKDAAFFFSPWNGFQVGYREGQTKFVYHANSGETDLYDLAADPTEDHDLADLRPQDTARMRSLLGAWVGYQESRIAALVSGDRTDRDTAASPRKIGILVTGISYRTPPRARVLLDGVQIGEFEALDVPNTAEAAASREAIDAALSLVELDLPDVACPKQLDIYFLNDEWAGEGRTGDTDLYVKSVKIGNRTYRPNEYSLLTERAGGSRFDYFGLWRKGGFRVSLDVPAGCLTADLGAGPRP